MAQNGATEKEQELLVRQTVMYLYRSAKFLPSPYVAEDSSRMSLAYFCLSALALLPSEAVSSIDPSLAGVDVMLKPEQRKGYVDWVYRLQAPGGGFMGSDSLAGTERGDEEERSLPTPIPLDDKEAADFARLMAFPDSDDEDPPHGEGSALPSASTAESTYCPPNLIQSYTALLILGILNDDFTRLNRAGLLRFVARCQMDDGSFAQFPGCPEPGDPRSTYSAFAMSSILDDWTAVDVDRALHFLETCQRPEGGFATRPFAEPQGGFTYCSIACYHLSSRLASFPNSARHLRWLVDRQVRPPPRSADDVSDEESDDEEQSEQGEPKDMAGFQGRSGKDTDACYSFWMTAALRLLRPDLSLLQPELDQRWLLECQHKMYGGIAREPGALPDVYHTYLSLAALSLSVTPSPSSAPIASASPSISLPLRPLDPAWNVSLDIAERMRTALAALPKLELDG
ncbi:terpenoid cyclases/protein prenyltransferase alpha-alpha toroid [Leucosporidium creatinivorum]|uniref:Terpenoid cyclases/protein prenyltransferase alpha-alpha toroid n=1 Tax=Leucosporidium creatinivorum TaxID=106004 RepID=A0A1Y2G4S1_9BASI|nr:terpenoid cyclases/protein prenyltransferase alpha-alpha toroid [Leucosporidium creatinivorum]